MEELFFSGSEHTVTCPSGRVITMRETNGADDELLSSVKNARTGDNVLNFLSNIIKLDSYLGKKPEPSDIKLWHVSDKYYLLFKQRLINQGHDMLFTLDCQNPQCSHFNKKQEIGYDISDFDGDLSNPDYKPGVPGQVALYPKKGDLVVEIETSSHIKIRFKVLNSILEKKRLDMPEDSRNNNSGLLIRDLEIMKSGWELVRHFAPYKTKDMSEIRMAVKNNDPLFDPYLNFKCPKCGFPYSVPLLDMPAFFWPEERI